MTDPINDQSTSSTVEAHEGTNLNRRQILKATVALSAAAVSGLSLSAQAEKATATSRLPLPEYDDLDVCGMTDLLRDGELTPLDLFDAAHARFDARKSLNLLAVEHFDQAREQAHKLSQLSSTKRREQMQNAPLLGVPFALKDLYISMKDTVTTNGNPFFKDNRADHDSTLVSRYQGAGLNIMAKLTCPEFGQTATTESALHGDTLNPWNLQYSAGGSSGGSAAAVAARILPAAHASDGGGSIRIPASHCGIFGLKPSRGRVPMGPGAMEGWMGLSVHNVVSRSVRDSALLLQLSQGGEVGSRVKHEYSDFMGAITKPPKPMRIAMMTHHPFGLPVHQDCLDAVNKTARLLTALGHKVEQASPTLPIESMFMGMGVTTSSGLLQTVQGREAALGRLAKEEEFSPIVWGHLQKAKKFTAQEVFMARSAFDKGGQAFDKFFMEYDLILAPVTAAPPPKIGELSLEQPYESFVTNVIKASPITALFNMTGLPAMSVPLHWNADGLPIGVQFAGPYGGEAQLLALAAQLEAVEPWAHKMPPMV